MPQSHTLICIRLRCVCAISRVHISIQTTSHARPPNHTRDPGAMAFYIDRCSSVRAWDLHLFAGATRARHATRPCGIRDAFAFNIIRHATQRRRVFVRMHVLCACQRYRMHMCAKSNAISRKPVHDRAHTKAGARINITQRCIDVADARAFTYYIRWVGGWASGECGSVDLIIIAHTHTRTDQTRRALRLVE